MPEGPEIRRAADQLAKALGSGPLSRAEIHRPGLEQAGAALIGQRVLSISPRGKALLTRFEAGLTLYTHNQLYGVWRVARPGERPPTSRSLRVVLETDQAALLLYSASDIALLDDAALAQHPFLRGLGPDVLDPTTTVEAVHERLASARFRGRRFASLLLDQGFLAGLGNYLRSEILFDAGLLAERRPKDLDEAEQARLAAACLALPRLSYATRGRKTRSRSAFRFAVFDRAGEPCLGCTAPIERSESGGRRLYFCPHCQC